MSETPDSSAKANKDTVLVNFDLEHLTEEEANAFDIELKKKIKDNPNCISNLLKQYDQIVADRKRIYPVIEVSNEELIDGKIWVITLLNRAGWIKSNSEGRRFIEQRAVSVRGLVFTSPGIVAVKDFFITEPEDIRIFDGDLLRCGKKYVAIVVN